MEERVIRTIHVLFLFAFLAGCQSEKLPELNAPGNEWIQYESYDLQNIDSVRYWGDSEKIRLQSAVILLNPANHTYQKIFLGTSVEGLDPAQLKWSEEESGKYFFSPDSTRVFFSNDPHTIFYFPAYRNNGIYHPSRLEQHDSLWYSVSNFSMAVSGRFVYTGKAE